MNNKQSDVDGLDVEKSLIKFDKFDDGHLSDGRRAKDMSSYGNDAVNVQRMLLAGAKTSKG